LIHLLGLLDPEILLEKRFEMAYKYLKGAGLCLKFEGRLD
jgi:hypothetical protein